jgi:lipopolysaccharide biosynthesis protein
LPETLTPSQIRAEIDRNHSQSRTKLIAFYLPQFHPTPENDEWWGKGFTEWTNVMKARPWFRGHYQPHLPADLGFYDLRLPEAREAQADLAKQYGISGFCYYHYWFHGRRILERPFGEVLATGKPAFPFCLCWANESWNRAWEEAKDGILVEQTYSHEDNVAHIRWLLNAFGDPRYIRIEGKPVFLVYRGQNLPDALQTAETWRAEARKAGIGDIFLCIVLSNTKDSRIDPTTIGFDAAVEFQPSLFRPRPFRQKAWQRLLRGPSNNLFLEYSEIINRALQAPEPSYRWFRCVTPSWDNTARRKTRALVLTGSHPDKYRDWLKAMILKSQPTATGDRVVFVNAWNEWAEGNHLEPCQRWGRAFLEATREAIRAADSEVGSTEKEKYPCQVLEAPGQW